MYTLIKLIGLVIAFSVAWIVLDFIIECVLDKTLRVYLSKKRKTS